MDEKAEMERIESALQTLGEHFDTVQIFVTRHESSEGGTLRVSKGTGNWFARYGHVRHWLLSEDEATRISVKPD